MDGWLEAHPGARLVVADALKKVRPRASGNRSIYDVDYETQELLLPPAAEYTVAIVVSCTTPVSRPPATLRTRQVAPPGSRAASMARLRMKRDRGRYIEEEEELALLSDPNTAGWCIIGEATSTD